MLTVMRGTDPLERRSFLVGKAIESHKLGSLEIKNMNACVQEVGITTFSAVVILLINHLRKKSEPKSRHSMPSVLFVN